MKKYSTIFNVVMWVLVIISVVLVVLGFTKSWPDSSVNMYLNYTYLMVALALFVVIVVGIIVAAANDPKSLIKLLGIVAGCVVICGGAYLLAKGNPAIGLSIEQPSAGTLKLTDTVLNLTYLFAVVAVIAIVFGEIVSAIRNK